MQETLNMFIFLSIELTLLFLAISYFVGFLQLYIPPKKIQSILSSKNGKGYFISAFLGAITPFCSCSTIPFLKGLIRAKAGFGPMMVFLFASPLLNPIIIGLFIVTFGLKITVFYFIIAMFVSVTAGYILEKINFEKYIKPIEYKEEPKSCKSSCNNNKVTRNKFLVVWDSTWKDFKKAFPYLLVGISLGSIIYGFVPTEIISKYAGSDNIFAIPFASIIGIPLYIRAEAVIPLSSALIDKGMNLGTTMAFIIGSAGASLTELILLKSIFRKQMIIAFTVVVLTMAMLSGYILNLVI